MAQIIVSAKMSSLFSGFSLDLSAATKSMIAFPYLAYHIAFQQSAPQPEPMESKGQGRGGKVMRGKLRSAGGAGHRGGRDAGPTRPGRGGGIFSV